MQELVKYFHGERSWSQLCQLYTEHGKHIGLLLAIKHCNGRELPIRFKLEEELEQLVKTASNGPSDHFPEVRKMVEDEEVVIPLAIPQGQSLKDLEERRTALWKQANTLHAQMKVMPTDEARLAISQKLREVWLNINLNWYAIDFFKAHGFCPNLTIEGDWQKQNTKTLYRLLLNMRSLLSKKRNKLKSLPTDSQEYSNLNAWLLSFVTEIETLTLVLHSRQ